MIKCKKCGSELKYLNDQKEILVCTGCGTKFRAKPKEDAEARLQAAVATGMSRTERTEVRSTKIPANTPKESTPKQKPLPVRTPQAPKPEQEAQGTAVNSEPIKGLMKPKRPLAQTAARPKPVPVRPTRQAAPVAPPLPVAPGFRQYDVPMGDDGYEDPYESSDDGWDDGSMPEEEMMAQGYIPEVSKAAGKTPHAPAGEMGGILGRLGIRDMAELKHILVACMIMLFIVAGVMFVMSKIKGRAKDDTDAIEETVDDEEVRDADLEVFVEPDETQAGMTLEELEKCYDDTISSAKTWKVLYQGGSIDSGINGDNGYVETEMRQDGTLTGMRLIVINGMVYSETYSNDPTVISEEEESAYVDDEGIKHTIRKCYMNEGSYSISPSFNDEVGKYIHLIPKDKSLFTIDSTDEDDLQYIVKGKTANEGFSDRIADDQIDYEVRINKETMLVNSMTLYDLTVIYNGGSSIDTASEDGLPTYYKDNAAEVSEDEMGQYLLAHAMFNAIVIGGAETTDEDVMSDVPQSASAMYNGEDIITDAVGKTQKASYYESDGEKYFEGKAVYFKEDVKVEAGDTITKDMLEYKDVIASEESFKSMYFEMEDLIGRKIKEAPAYTGIDPDIVSKE